MKKGKVTRCYLCDKELDKIAIALNKKLIDKNVTHFYCLSCLANYLDVTEEDLLTKAEEFKSQGCKLF